MDLTLWIFIILLGGSAFTLRGIWGHNLGGAAMGIIMGLGISVIYDLPPMTTLHFVFWYSIAWAIGAFVGWARHKTFQRFIRGYLAYGLVPNIALGLNLFQGNFSVILQIVLIGPLGMAIGFGISYRLLKTIRASWAKMYEKDHPEKVNWGDKPFEAGEKSHIFIFRFDTWKILLEIFSGILYTLTTIPIIEINQSKMSLNASPIEAFGFLEYFMIFLLFIFVPLGLVYALLEDKSQYHGWALKEDQTPLRKELAWKILGALTVVIIVWGIILGTSLSLFFSPFKLFLIMYWFINILAKFYNPLSSKLFQTDIALDLILGIIITVFLIIS